MVHQCLHEEDFGALRTDVEYIKKSVDTIMNNHLAHIQQKLYTSIPSWATITITILGSITTGLIVRTVTMR
jgi:hypothetical protein